MSTTTGTVSAAEWAALRSGAAVAARDAGLLWLTGTDALDLLNRITTNKLEELPPGSSTATVLTNGDGRVIDLLTLAATADGIWCTTSPGREETVAEWIDLYTFGEDLSVTDRSGSTKLISVVGPDAPVAIAASGLPPMEPGAVAESTIADVAIVATRGMPGGADGFDVLVPAEAQDAVIAALVDAGATAIGVGAWDAYRIANGMPAYGSEFGEFNNPLEPRLMGAISEDKGCYTGQEIIARLITYQKIQHRLMAATLSGPLEPGTELMDSGERAGRITSTGILPDGMSIGLALVRSAHAAAGAELDAGDAGASATLAEPAYAQATEPLET